MYHLLLKFIIFFITIFLSSKYRSAISQSIKLIDYPDKRKDHRLPTPLIGGLISVILITEYLITNNYTKSDILIIDGTSAGGLLIAGCMTMRPELYKIVIADVPFVDVLNTMADPRISLTTFEWKECGNPNKQKYYDSILEYSPYNNIKKVNYPNCLFLTSLNDNRVGYWEPLKFIAKLRNYCTDTNIHLLYCNTDGGHFPSSDKYDYLNNYIYTYAFIIKLLHIII